MTRLKSNCQYWRVNFHNGSLLIWISLYALSSLIGCASLDMPRQVVLYVSVDQVYAEPVLRQFEENTGIKVKAVYDVEASKTTGLVNRLIAEKDRPLADVFWSGEFAQTILLKQLGVLTPYYSPNAVDIPKAFKDPEGYWTGFGGRARILLVNTSQLPENLWPDSIYDMLDENYSAGRIGLAYPLFGTTATHAAALYAYLGSDRARTFFQALVDRGVSVVDGNSVVKERVANGEWVFGLTDTDDACKAIQSGATVKVIFPDQGAEQMGTLVIPNTVALVAGAPQPSEGQILVDFLLSRSVEEMLVESGWIQFPLRQVGTKPICYNDLNIKTMPVNLEQIFEQIETAKQELAEINLR
jgi:iron(III) transport system substrate-binding protein